jgi:hypothetical protein
MFARRNKFFKKNIQKTVWHTLTLRLFPQTNIIRIGLLFYFKMGYHAKEVIFFYEWNGWQIKKILLDKGGQPIFFAKWLQRGFRLQHSTVLPCNNCKKVVCGSPHVKIALITIFWRIMPFNICILYKQTIHLGVYMMYYIGNFILLVT